jgi:signal transduction histidine kinase/CheY-like chemotaxis protein
MRNIAIAVNTAESREKMRGLLQKTQMQSKELRIQKEELQTQAEELQAQAEELQTQTAELQAQQEELLKINEDLNQHTQKLEHQRQEILEKNIALEKTQVAVELKSKELELASRYKSEFLANMSHELRTPLNSILILAQLLSKNSQSNLTEKQVEYAKTILQSGSDLLVLISEVLDLSKVEAGKIEVHIENLPLVDLVGRIESKFRSLAEQKGLNFHVSLAKNLPLTIQTDTQRLQQILNNLLSNAFKFTAQGEVKLTVQRQTANELTNRGLSHSLKVLTFNVLDTGIGIPENKKEVIFEAFRQADGKTSRQFGGTGLGLTITRQLARILGGDVKVESEVGKGSIFTLYLPETQGYVLSDSVKTDVLTLADSAIKTQQKGEFIPDDRNNIEENDKVILIIENDPKFSNILVELAREKNFKAVVAENGKKGLQFVKEYAPSAIMLDVGLPTIDGWTVMERLKDDSETRHIPVHFIAASGQKLVAKKMGAIGYLLKPSTIDKLREAFDKIECFIAKKQKNLLVIAHGEFRVQKIMDIVNMDNICIVTESTLADAVQKIKEIPFDCIILDVDVRDCSNMSFLRERKNKEQLLNIPIITYISRELTAEEDILWKQCTGELALKTVRSPERLLDETTLFLHQSEADLPQDKRSMLQLVYDKGSIFKGKRILLVDDDARNVFALATVLEDKEMEVIVSKNGREALNALETESNISIILMDIMMPEMDGYETMRKIRENENFRKLPIIALTAKAMKGDKAKCIESGANDYLSKPVDTDRLMSLMRVWLYQ